MREIKFRGQSKKTDNQKMVYGYGCYTDESERHFILTDNPIPMTPVEVEKIQRFTGLLNKHKKEIYEGDIINIFKDETKRRFEIVSLQDFFEEKGYLEKGLGLFIGSEELEIIG